MESNNYECRILKDDKRIKDLAFSVDITYHVNKLNLQLQGKHRLVPMLFDSINGFKQKLVLWQRQIQKETLTHFECCQILLQKSPDLKFSEYVNQLKLLETGFERRFLDFKKSENQFNLFISPLTIDVETVDENIQMEINETQCDSIPIKTEIYGSGNSTFL